MTRWLKRLFTLTLVGLFTVFLAIFCYFLLQRSQRPDRTPHAEQLFEGIHYERRPLDEPRPVLAHILTVDLTTPSLHFIVTPPDAIAETDHLNARTTTEFLEQFEPQIAINASFFYTFYQSSPLSYYPHSGDPVTTLGPVIADGVRYSADDDFMRTMCIIGRTITLELAGCPDGTENAVAGNAYFVRDGRVSARSEELLDKPYARTTVGLDESGKTLWIVLIDGKQRGYSEGLTLSEMGDFLINLGVHRAINLDGGGSVTLGINSAEGPQILNAPIHARVPMWERPVANHIGIFADPVAAEQ